MRETPDLWIQRQMTRRHLLGSLGMGIGAMALQSLNSMAQAEQKSGTLGGGKAKRIIYLHMAGAPSQFELFENKPELAKLHLQDAPASFLEGKRFAFIRGVPKVLAGQFGFKKHGQSGQELSELLPHLSGVADKVCVLRGVHTDQFNHAPAQLFVQTGSARLGNPSMGSWVTYGLGSGATDLPGFVVLLSGGKTPDGGKSLWGSGFLPSVYQGVQCRTDGDPVLYLSDPEGMSRGLRRRMLDALAAMNTAEYARSQDPETLTRVEQYELAYRMQLAVPEVMDISKEPRHVLEMYGAVPKAGAEADNKADPRTFYRGNDPTFANNCVLARRLLEAGVRFVQLYDWGWDHHGSSPGESIDETLPIKCQQTDRAIAALLKDLEQRGMLEDTLVVWGGEFGRTPMMQNNVRSELKRGFIGRDHHPHAFTMWMAGGGVRPGISYGKTDEFGYYPVENAVSLRDVQATILHQLGLDPFRLRYAFQGLDQRLIGPSDDPRVIQEILL
jgi:hypothetical protein